MVRALVLDDGRTRLAIATCDTCVIPRDLLDEAKELASRRTGIPADRMLMAATHTHTAPTLTDLNPKVPRDPEYLKLVVEGLAEGVAQAAGRTVPARIGWGVAPLPEEVNNRRWFMREELLGPNPFGRMDRVRMNPPAGSPDLARPAGPTDPMSPWFRSRRPTASRWPSWPIIHSTTSATCRRARSRPTTSASSPGRSKPAWARADRSSRCSPTARAAT